MACLNRMARGSEPVPTNVVATPGDGEPNPKEDELRSVLTGTAFTTTKTNLINSMESYNRAAYESQYIVQSLQDAWQAVGDDDYVDQAFDFIEATMAAADVATPVDVQSGGTAPQGIRPQTSLGATKANYLGWSGQSPLSETQYASGVLRLCYAVNTPRSQAIADWFIHNIVEKYATAPGPFNAGMANIVATAVSQVPIVDAPTGSGYWNDKIFISATNYAYADALQPGKSYYQNHINYQDWLTDFAGSVTIDGQGCINWDVNNSAPGANHNGPGNDSHGPDTSHTNRVPNWMEAVLTLDPGNAAATMIDNALQRTLEDKILLKPQAGCTTVANYIDGSNAQFLGFNGPETTPPTNQNHGMSGFLFPGWTRYTCRSTAIRDCFQQVYDQAKAWDKQVPVDLAQFPCFDGSISRHASAFGQAALCAALAKCG